MAKLCRITVIILIFLLLTSIGVSALAALRSGEGETKKAQEVPEVALPHQQMNVGWEPAYTSLAPPWQPDRSGSALTRSKSEPLPIEPALLRVLAEAEVDGTIDENGDEGDYVPVILHLHEQIDFDELASTPDVRRSVVSALQIQAARSQTSLRAYLEGAQAAGTVDSYTPFWIFNGIGVRARPSFVHELAAHPDVAMVHLDHYRQWISWEGPDPSSQTPAPAPGSPPIIRRTGFVTVEWGIARVRADEVWASLRISGTGAVVAGMDTGVDWLHPALQTNYRAYNPHGPANHTTSWYDATDGGALYPVDSHGHGSHTMGTVVGQGGIGVAPGARWIAVRVINSEGYGLDSWIHTGFQWLLAPGGDPDQTPDVVNNSWGNKISSLTIFQPDLQALRASGILAVFANGNYGPDPSSVESPASLPEAFGVGATDADDQVTSFSSRGPSPWGEIRPHVVAPGLNVRSSLPGGAYALMNGTSMAAPHVTGIVALLRSVSPTVSITHTAYLITSTAVPLSSPVPNNDAGWGRVDSFAAVVALAQPGLISGTVQAEDGQPIVGATIQAVSRGGEGGGRTIAKDSGSYLLALAPGDYDLIVSAFGFEPITIWAVAVTAGTTTVRDVSLSALPAGVLQGYIRDASTGNPVTATVSAVTTPRETLGTAYTFTLPAGTYTLRARSLGYRIVTTTAVVTADQVTILDLSLPPAPSILLVDSGRWYYDSQANYFRQAFEDLSLAYDEWPITYLTLDNPATTDLAPYDVVVWSAPSDAPGYIGAEDAIVGYLSGGGRLLLTGQDIGFWDGGGTIYYWSPYYLDYLKARFVSDRAPTRVLEGLAGDIFAGLTITIAGPGGADNQSYPDEIGVADPDAASPLLAYREGHLGGIRVGTCLDYQAVYLSFGFEAIADRAARQEVMGRALDWLSAPPPAVGLEVEPSSQPRIGLPGSVVTHTVRIRHIGQAGITDTVSLSLDGTVWATQLNATSVSLAPCTSATVAVTVTLPITADWDGRDVISLAARSSLSPTLVQTATLTSKVVAPILLVDDGRWTNQSAKYEMAMAEAGFSYDTWRARWTSIEAPGGGPPLDVLHRYPIVIWFTSYDWFEPVTADEEATLAAYLDGGGRLLLSSQDFLYYHHAHSPFSRDYLGVMAYAESVTPTLASGVPEDVIGDRLGPYTLNYPFTNWSDAAIPAPDVGVSFRDQERHGVALVRQGDGYRTAFFSFPIEVLPETGRAAVMERGVGWLSWIGRSQFVSDRSTVSGGDVFTYTAALHNDGPVVAGVSLSNTLPLSLTLLPGSMTGPAIYHAPTRRVSWEGQLAPGTALTFTYRVTVAKDLPALAPVANVAQVGLEDQGIHFRRISVVRVDAPDLSSSHLRCDPSPVRPSGLATCTLSIANAGIKDASQATIIAVLPDKTTLVPGSPTWTGDGLSQVPTGTMQVPTGTVHWTGPLGSGSHVSLTYQFTLPAYVTCSHLYNVTFLEDGMGRGWERAMWLPVEPLRVYLPRVLRNGS